MDRNWRSTLEAALERLSWLQEDDPAACSMRAAFEAFSKFRLAYRPATEVLDLRRKVSINLTAAQHDEPFASRIAAGGGKGESWKAVLCEYTWALHEEPEILARWEDDGGRAPDDDEVRRRVLNGFSLGLPGTQPRSGGNTATRFVRRS